MNLDLNTGPVPSCGQPLPWAKHHTPGASPHEHLCGLILGHPADNDDSVPVHRCGVMPPDCMLCWESDPRPVGRTSHRGIGVGTNIPSDIRYPEDGVNDG